MSSNRYISDPNVPFFSVDDSLDDETFLRQSRQASDDSGYLLAGRRSGGAAATVEERLAQRQQQLAAERQLVEQRTAAAAQRSLGVLHESEQVGLQTADDLVCQREQLERTESRLDDINASLNNSQKHINNIKSVFSSLRSYFGGRNATTTTTTTTTATATSPVVGGAVNTPRDNQSHPTLVARGVEVSSVQCQRQAGRDGSAGDYDTAFNHTLDDMCAGLSRLQGLATGLQTEIVDQNQMLDRIQEKTERADITINTQNKQMTRILKK